ncbi:dermonecrotic toxin domain-containing protein [Pseudomonas reactans]|uniref:dermonecrotic toxin domain-containing protein n=1 Tax=Pseudomonas reactans TaxID=117680 RepID=UPI00159FBC54|nr:DUF6543 domain-containing protein [Pseudomonas reactans]NWA70198.1 hypothetical protein [Pseudomonas reactans]
MSTTQETLSQAVETGMPLSPAAYGAKLIREQWGADIDPQTAQLVTLDYNYHGHPAVDGVEQGQVHSQQPLIQALLLNYQAVGDNRFFETAFGFYTPPAIGPAVKIVEHVDELAFHGAGNHDSYEGIYRRTDPQTYGPQTQLPVTPAAFKQWAWRLELTTLYTRYLNTTWPSDDTIKARPSYAVRTSVKTAYVMAAFLQKNAGSLSMAGLQLALLSAGLGDNQVRFSYINSAQLEHWTRPMDTVQVSRLVIYRYTARDLWVFTHRSSGLTLLYVPGNSSPLHEFADLNALRAWVVQQAGDPLKKTALATHFAKDDRGDGTFHAGVQTALEAMLVYPKRHHLTRNAGFFNDDGYWNPQQYISLADEPQTTDPFADLVAVMKQMSFENVQDSIRDDAQVNRDNLSAIVEPTVRWLNQWGALALFFPGGEGVLGLAGLIEAGYGVSEVVSATGADERNEGVTRTVFGVLNALPLFLKAAHGVPEAQVPEVKPTPEPEPVVSGERPPTPTVDTVVQSFTDLTLPQLMRGLGPAVEPFTDEVLEQIRKVSGVSDDNLRVMYAEHRAPRGLLADTLDRFKIDQDLQTIIEQLRNGLHPDVGPAQLMQWVTQDPAWPVEQGVQLIKDNKVLWEYVGTGSTHQPLVLQVTNNDMLRALLRGLEFSQTRALIGEVAEGSAPLPDLSTQVQLLRKKLASRLQRQRPQLFEARYRALQKTDRDVLLYLHLEHPSLSRVLLEELLSAEHLTGEEHLTLGRIKALLKELETRGQSLETSVRQARAYEGVFLESVRNVDSDTLLLHTVERMPGWSGGVCIEVREGSFNGRVLDRIGFKSAAQKRYLVKIDMGYQLYDDAAHTLHPSEPFAEAVLHALPETERAAMRLHADDGLPNFMRKVRQQALSPNDLNTVLARQQLRTPFFDPDDGGLKGGSGASVTVGAQALANEVMRSSVKAFYPDFTDAMADEFWARFGHDGAPAELTRLKAEYVKLESELEAWVNDTSTAPDEIVELTDADWERAGEFIDDDSESEDDGSYEWSKSNDDRIQRHGSILEREIVQTPLQQRLQDALPLWLVHADDQDVKAYVQHLTALAVAQHEAAGRDFLEGVPQIKAFAEHLLQQCLDAEPNAARARAADISLKFTQVVGAGMPGGFAVGGIQHLSMSLTELALENLVGFAHTAVAITVKGQPASTRLTYALLKGCVTQANVGQSYPDLLKRTFMTDATEAKRREQLFVAQLRAQLPLLALEQKIKRAQGLTTEGYRWLAAAVQATQALRKVDGQAAALCPLAFKARPGDSVDGVVNMYIIGPAAGEGGPHLLYRPLLQPVLCEYPSLEALFAAIKVAGPLHDSVLDWIAPARRHVYANGGFAEPHIEHALPGDEFTPPPRPEPAQLSQQLVAGDPLHHVFVGTVQALVTLADAQSVSNAQARWATLKAGGWLLFGEVLPMLSGPAGLAGWLFQLMASLQQDTQAQVEGDPADKRQATADLLFNLVTVLAAHMTPADALPRHVPEHPAYEPGLPNAPKRVEPSTRVVKNTQPSGWFDGADVLHPTLQARLEAMSLGSGAVKGVLETGGALKGLFRDGTQWQAQVRGRRYRVQVRQGSVRVVSADGETLGPWLKRVDDAYWDIDLRLRLAGGNADEVIAERQRADNDNVPRLEADLASLREQIESADKAINVAHGVLGNSQMSEAQRKTVHDRFVQELKRKHESVLLEVQVLKQLRTKGPRRGYEQELCSTLENLILTEQLLSAQMRLQTMRINNALRPALDRAEAVEDNATRTPDQHRDEMEIVEGLRQLAEINDDALRWRAMQDRHLQELREVPRFGRDRAALLSPGTDNQPSLMDLHSLQLTNLWALSLDSSHTAIDEVFLQDVNKLVERARWAIRSHTSLESLTFATDAERIELVENINQIYGETSDSLEYWREMRPEYFHAPYVEKLQQLLNRMHYEAELHLTDLLSAIRTPTPPPPPTRIRPAKKIIRIRNQDMLVTTIKEPSAESPQEVAELKDENQQVLASFTQAADGMWEQVTAPVARPVAGPKLNHLLEQGQKLLEQVEPSISKVLKQAPTANEPQSLQDILDQQASTLRECAQAINQRLLQDDVSQLAATQRAKAQTRAHALTAAASRLAEQGLQARVTAVKSRPPTQGGVDFLFSQQEVQIYRMDERVPLKGRRNDFLQVYGVFDTHDHQPLCYAHFHYESAKAFNDHFTAAHLKTPEQHRLGKQAQARAQEQANALIQAGQSGRAQPNLAIYRSEINLRMARRLFFDATSWQGWW